jgi:hypothetical protein
MEGKREVINHEKIIQAIYAAIDEVNQMMPEDQRLEKSLETVILDGSDGALDSQGLINFTVATEETIESIFGIEMSLTDENIFLQETSPLKTVGTLADYIFSFLEEKKSE